MSNQKRSERTREQVTDGDSNSEGDGGQDLETALQESRELAAHLKEEVSALKAQLAKERLKVKEIWRKSCDQLWEFEEEIEYLKGMLEGLNPVESVPEVTQSRETPKPRRGKAPPVYIFSGESLDLLLDDWLPSLQRAADWNGWTDKEQLLQLAGHLRGRAFQE